MEGKAVVSQRRSRHDITVEAGLYGLILLLAGFLRLARLDLLPLDIAESARALAAWQWLHGQPPELWQEPAVELATGLTFLLFGDSDATARWISAVVGTGLVALVWQARELIGRWPALLAATLLALSPTQTYASRSLSGEVWGGALTLLAALLLIRSRGPLRFPQLTVAAAISALLFQVGAPGVTGLLTLGAFLALWWAVDPAGFQERFRVEQALSERRSLMVVAALFVGVSVAVGSGLFFHLAGVGLAGIPAWVRQFDPSPDGPPWYVPALRLLAYEPLAVVFGLVGGVAVLWRWRRGDLSPATGPGMTSTPPRGAFVLFLVVWAGFGLVLLLLAQEGAFQLFVAPILPLTLLTAGFWGDLMAAAQAVDWKRVALVLVSFVALAGGVLLALLQLSFSSPSARQPLSLVAPVVTGGLLLALALWSTHVSYEKAGKALLISGGVLLLLFTWRNSWSLNFGPGASEWLGAPRLSGEARELALRVERQANQPQQAGGFSLAVDPELRAPLAWYLRGLTGAASFQGSQPGASALLRKVRLPEDRDFREYQPYRGLLFTSLDPAGASLRGWWRWLLVREAPTSERRDQEVFLYLKGGAG